MIGNSQKRPPPPPRRQMPPPEAKINEDAKPSTELQNLLSSLRKEQNERYRNQDSRGSGCRPPPPPPSNAGRGRGNGTKPVEGAPPPPGRPEAPRPLRMPFASDVNQNVFQDADEKLVGKPKTQVQKPIQTPSVGVEEKIKKEVVKSSSDINQNIFKDADEKKVEKPKTCSTQPSKPKNYGDTEIDAAVRELILADARPLPPEPPKFNLEDYVKKMPHTDHMKYIATTLSLEIKNIERPIGMIVLRKTKTIIISEQGRNQVQMYNPDGSTKKVVQPGKAFFKPSDMVELKDGQFAVRDNNGIQIFSDDGKFIKNIGENYLGRVFGLTSNEDGNIFTINHNPHVGREKEGNVTAKGEIDIVEIDIENDTVIRQIELVDVIQNVKETKCRFLHCNGNKLYIADLGLDCVYILSLKDNTSVRKFGTKGKADGQFKDPAGLVTDSFGNLILADAGNHRLQMFDKSRKFVGNVNIYQGLKRPSGIYLDQEEEALYVLNLNGNCMRKYALKKN